jgi:hypothetical protein
MYAVGKGNTEAIGDVVRNANAAYRIQCEPFFC